MNYMKIYDELIARAKNRSLIECYKERHHIQPKSLGGSDAINNIVELTGREHFIAHVLLAKIHGGNMWIPVIRMKDLQKNTNSRLYEIAKKQMSLVARSRKHTFEAKQKISMNNASRKNGAIHLKSPDVILRRSAARKGKPLSDQNRAALSLSMKGRAKTPEHIAKANFGRKCAYLNKLINSVFNPVPNGALNRSVVYDA